MEVSAIHTVHHQGCVGSIVDGVTLAMFLNQALVSFQYTFCMNKYAVYFTCTSIKHIATAIYV